MTTLAPEDTNGTAETMLTPANLSNIVSLGEIESTPAAEGSHRDQNMNSEVIVENLEPSLDVDQLASQLVTTSITAAPASPVLNAAELRDLVVQMQSFVLNGAFSGNPERRWGSSQDAQTLKEMRDTVFNHPLEPPKPDSKNCGQDNIGGRRTWMMTTRIDFSDRGWVERLAFQDKWTKLGDMYLLSINSEEYIYINPQEEGIYVRGRCGAEGKICAVMLQFLKNEAGLTTRRYYGVRPKSELRPPRWCDDQCAAFHTT